MQDDSDETLDRVRRIETKVTKLGESMGIDMGGMKPVYKHGEVHAPSPMVPLARCVDAIPKDVVHVVPVRVRGDVIARIARP